MDRLAGLGGRGSNWLSKVIDTLKNVPFVSNVVFAVVLVCLEKLVETEFSCPCDHRLDFLIVFLYFVVPALLTFILMCFMLEFQFWDRNNCCGVNWLRSAFICFIPAIVWMSLLFFDGRYVACAATKWSGMCVATDKNVHKKWCQSTNSSVSELKTTQWWFGVSQLIGLGVLGLIIASILIYKCCRMCCCEASGEDSIETLYEKLQEIKKAAKVLEDAVKLTRDAANKTGNESAVKTAKAVKESAAAVKAAKDSAVKTVKAVKDLAVAAEAAVKELAAAVEAAVKESAVKTTEAEKELAVKIVEAVKESAGKTAEAVKELAGKTAEAVKELETAAESAATAAKPQSTGTGTGTGEEGGAEGGAGEGDPLIDTSGHKESATQQQHHQHQEPVTSAQEISS